MTFQRNHIECTDALTFLKSLPDESVNCVCTSPPYFGLRSYLPTEHEDKSREMGSEPTPQAFVAALVGVFREARRVLRDDGVIFLNLGDSYSGSGKGIWNVPDERKSYIKETYRPSVKTAQQKTGLKPKDRMMIPARVAIALQDDGWYLRDEIVWHKPNAMPSSVTDRTTSAHEMIYLLTKSPRYWYDAEAIREPFADERMGDPGAYNRTTAASKGANNNRQDLGFLNNGSGWDRGAARGGRNKRSVWTVATQPTPEAHFATFPRKLIEPMILAGCPAGGLVLDPFMGSGTTALVARQLGRDYIGCDLNAEYVAMANRRLSEPFTLPMMEVR